MLLYKVLLLLYDLKNDGVVFRFFYELCSLISVIICVIIRRILVVGKYIM